jgi:MFS family permease
MKSSPYLVAAPFTVIVYGLSAVSSGLGAVALLAGAIVGLAWALVVGRVARRIGRREQVRAKVEDALVFGGVVATAFLMCGGIMMILLMGAALNEPSTSYQTLSAMMAPTLPYFIIANNVLELIVAPSVVFVGWRPGRRRTLLLAAVAGFFVVRIWTYLVYAERRTQTATGPLSADDVQWYKDTLVVDYRPVLLGLILVLFLMAAFLPAHSWSARRTAERPVIEPP